MSTRVLYVPEPVKLPDGIKRSAPRPVELRDESYDERFDWDTFIYDAFLSDGVYHIIAPPLLGQDWRIDMQAAFDSIGADLTSMMWLDKSLRIKARIRDGVSPVSSMVVPFKEAAPVTVKFNTLAGNDIFAGQRVLVTMSKDNEISWVRDWIRFHRRIHGATGVLIYDNNSTRYTSQELFDGLADLDIASLVVVPWPFKYGPQGLIQTNSHWDSNFCQHGGLEHARYCFLQKAVSFLNCDVDELIVPVDGRRSVFDDAESGSGYTFFAGQWTEPLTAEGEIAKPVAERRHRDFVLRAIDPAARAHHAYKYCVAVKNLDEGMQCATHRIIDAKKHGQFAFPATTPSNAFTYRHFKAINTNWRWQRDWMPRTQMATLEVDKDLKTLMDLSIAR